MDPVAHCDRPVVPVPVARLAPPRAPSLYAAHFGLAAEPFSLTPDPEFLYLSRGHSEALAALRVGLTGRRGLIVMTGEVGTGKTTLLYALLRAVGDAMRTAYVANTTVGFDGILRLALADFGVPGSHRDRVEMLAALNGMLRDCAERDGIATLIIDEAQTLDVAAFEQLRQLSNFESFSHKLLQIVLVGQPELEARLALPELRALTERVAVHCRLTPLGIRESRAYVDHRLERAGGAADLFEPGARDALLRAAEGLPRRINILCDSALLFAYGRGAAQVTTEIARAAIAERAHLTAGRVGRAQRWVRDVAGSAVAAAAPAVGQRARRLWAAASQARAPIGAWWHRPTALPPGGVAAVATALGLVVAVAGVQIGREQAPQAPAATAMRSAAGPASMSAPPQPPGAGIDPVDMRSGAHAGVPSVRAAAADAPPADDPATAPGRAAVPLVPAPAAEPPASSAPAGGDAAAASDTRPADLPERRDAHFRDVRVQPGATLAALARAVYGAVDADLIKRIQSANPQVVNPNLIVAGDVLRFPEIDLASTGAAKEDRP
jgi:general secretion pathway protein A